MNGNVRSLIGGKGCPNLLLHHTRGVPRELHEFRMLRLHLYEQRIADIHVEFQPVQCRGEVIHQTREQCTASGEGRAALFRGETHDRLRNLYEAKVIHPPCPCRESRAARTEEVHRDVADLCLGDGEGKYFAQLRRNHACCREFLRAAQLSERPHIHHNRIVLLHAPHGKREMDD